MPNASGFLLSSNRRITGFFLDSAEAGSVAPDLRRATGQGQPPPFAYRAVPAPGE